MISTQLLQPKTVTTFTMSIVETDRSSNLPFRPITALGKDYVIDGQNTQLIYFFEKMTTDGGKKAP